MGLTGDRRALGPRRPRALSDVMDGAIRRRVVGREDRVAVLGGADAAPGKRGDALVHPPAPHRDRRPQRKARCPVRLHVTVSSRDVRDDVMRYDRRRLAVKHRGRSLPGTSSGQPHARMSVSLWHEAGDIGVEPEPGHCARAVEAPFPPGGRCGGDRHPEVGSRRRNAAMTGAVPACTGPSRDERSPPRTALPSRRSISGSDSCSTGSTV